MEKFQCWTFGILYLTLICQKILAHTSYLPIEINREMPIVINNFGKISGQYNKMGGQSPAQNLNDYENWSYIRDLINDADNDIMTSKRIFVQPTYVEISIPLPTLQSSVDQLNIQSLRNWKEKNISQQKKNSNYMSACHFKICNLGRKRNVRIINI